MNVNVRKRIGGFLCMILLIGIIIGEFRYGFSMLEHRQLESIGVYTAAAATNGKARVSIDELMDYPEVPDYNSSGDIIQLGSYDVRLRIDGTVTDTSSAAYGYYYYTNSAGVEQCTLTVQKVQNDIAEDRDAFQQYWYGNTLPLQDRVSLGTAGTVNFYQDSVEYGKQIVAYNESNLMWYMVIELGDTADAYLLVSAPDPFVRTNERPKANFGDPAIAVMTAHTYSTFESLAAEAKLKKLKEKEIDESMSTQIYNPYQASVAGGSHSTFTSADDDMIRQELINYAQHNWDENGVADDTSVQLDITSEEAKKSEWALTETTYAYTANGLKISMLEGSRSATTFNLKGNINNTLDAARPYVLVIKFIGTGKLLGIKVIDKTSEPIDPESVTTFATEINKLSDKIDVTKITAVQFEIY